MLDVTQLDFVDHLVDTLPNLVFGHTFERCVDLEMLTCSQVVEEDVVLGTDAELFTQPVDVVEEILAHERCLSLRGCQ